MLMKYPRQFDYVWEKNESPKYLRKNKTFLNYLWTPKNHLDRLEVLMPDTIGGKSVAFDAIVSLNCSSWLLSLLPANFTSMMPRSLG